MLIVTVPTNSSPSCSPAKLIFLDEPTSGLDSSISLEVMGAARGLANQGRTVISTIHQPSPEVFGLFDRAVLISGGRLIYSGPADEAVAYFTRPELGYKYDKNQNPAEFIIEVCGGSSYPEGWITPRQPEELQELYNKSSYVQKPAEQVDFESEQNTYTRRHATGKLTCFKMLMHRSWFSRIRDKKDIKTNFFKVLFSGLAIGCVFYGKADLSYPFLVEDARTQELILVPEVNSCVSLVFISTM
jgi:ATP-binding cassette, subfamily G (WHITE), eye pigment precursor transporter